MTGLVFDIEEFAVFDGPGIRTVVFLKGCPLRCAWCHNPEGLSPRPSRVKTIALCVECGTCRAVCPSPGGCTACGACVPVCPKNCLRIAGQSMMPQDVAARVLPNRALLEMAGGGVTFSGGEPLLQADFVIELTRALSTVHLCMETSGYAPEDVFTRAVDCMDLVIMDIKLADTREHRRWTGVGNELIKRNLEALKQSGKPFWIRIPMIPGVTDGEQNMRETAEFLRSARHLQKVELLRYNKAAGAKYAGLDMVYAPTFSEKEPPQTLVDIFKEANIPCAVL